MNDNCETYASDTATHGFFRKNLTGLTFISFLNRFAVSYSTRMKYFILFVFFILSHSLLAGTLQVELEKLRSKKGTIRYLLFEAEKGYPDKPEKSVAQGNIPADKDHFTIKDLAPGEYALTLIHDENNNEKLDTKIGIPAEGFGFSNNPFIFFGPPSYKRSSFKLKKDMSLTIRMNYM